MTKFNVEAVIEAATAAQAKLDKNYYDFHVEANVVFWDDVLRPMGFKSAVAPNGKSLAIAPTGEAILVIKPSEFSKDFWKLGTVYTSIEEAHAANPAPKRQEPRCYYCGGGLDKRGECRECGSEI